MAGSESTVLSKKTSPSSSRSYTKSTQSGNAEAIANNFYLLIQILVCLPVKSLVRFKSVSKAWHSLISDPKFCCRIFPPISGVTIPKIFRSCSNPEIEHETIPLSHKSTADPFKVPNIIDHSLKILQSCNGLLLCRNSRDFFNGLLVSRYDYYVYNSTIKQFVAVPPPAYPSMEFAFGFSLAFDPFISAHYKIVCVRESDQWLGQGVNSWFEKDPHPGYRYRQIEIYSSQTRSWRLSGDPFLAKLFMGFDGGVFCNGAIHWLAIWGTTSLYFNVEEEKVRELPMPPIPDGFENRRRSRNFEESRGKLHLIEIYGPQTTQFNVYEIESDYSGWLVKYCVDLDPLKTVFPKMIATDLDPSDLNYHEFSVLCIVREAKEEESYMVLHIPENAIKFNLKDGSFMKICDIDPDIEVDMLGLNSSVKLSFLSED